MPTAEINGIQLYYEDYGSGFPIVFAHGAGGNHMSWWQQVPVLSRHYRCITFDHRGWGLSLDVDDSGPAAFIRDLTSLIDHLKLEKTFLVAQSMGGLSCLGFAVGHPDRVRGLVMANTFAGMRREVWLASSDELHRLVQSVWERRRGDAVKRALGRGFAAAHKDRAFLYKQIRMLNEQGPNRLQTELQVQRLRALERTAETGINREALAALPTPVLFIGGEDDEVMPVSLMAVAQTLIPNARMNVVSGAGHSVYFEQPDVFNQLLLDFLSACDDS
ncbi:MAG: alpha/beta hydrolase [Chloroflexi bacterium]|nr:MAG: alpha/beta hydrolase [Chloroflexota bacterium]